MRHPIITLTTDFGSTDHFVGTLKGVILSIAPQAQIVDITHDVVPFEVRSGAFQLSQAYRYFPRKTIHVAVVDPGVGSARRPLLAEAGGHYFIAPDNGLLSMILSRQKHKVRAITADRYFLKPVSRTFHGRDIFAPCAAHLAAGVAPARFGKLIQDYLKPASERPSRISKRAWTGTILHIDRFGNLITNLEVSEFHEVSERPFELAVGLTHVRRFAPTYAECAPGEIFVLAGSAGYLEVAANQGSAARMLGCGVGAPVELTLY